MHIRRLSLIFDIKSVSVAVDLVLKSVRTLLHVRQRWKSFRLSAEEACPW
jgi:hypothetical protein